MIQARIEQKTNLTRRQFLAGSGAALAAAHWSPKAFGAGPKLVELRLKAAPARAKIAGAEYRETEVWAYNGRVTGPEIRAVQGDRLRVVVENGLSQDTSVHWHGVRLPNLMDGVPHLTQEPIRPGASYAYEFDLQDAGTFWYHPHWRSHEQVGRGLHGALIVEEREPPAVDRDLVWVLGDWRLDASAQIDPNFGHMFDVSHAGRIGNTVTVNGAVAERIPVRRGERVRLRLINVANARIFALDFTGHRPIVIARDAHPVDPYFPDEPIRLGPGMRADLVLDATGEPGSLHPVIDRFAPRQEYRLLDLQYVGEARSPGARAPISLAGNPVPEPDIARANRHEFALGGGMMGNLGTARVGERALSMREMMQHGLAWAINGIAQDEHGHAPLLTLKLGETAILAFRNDTVWNHPMHLHGHVFRVLSRNGVPAARRELLDTVLVGPRESVEVAFVADNPGNWMLHCHVLEHQAGGMGGVIRVA
jgi:FtsP/CotA-like multicopper oxidase with cupredoxin domain